MKQFIRTGFGKTLLFLLCIAAVIMAALSAVGIVFAVQEAETVYGSSSLEEFMSDIYLGQLKYEGYEPVMIAAEHDGNEEEGALKLSGSGNVILRVENAEGQIVAVTGDAEKIVKWPYTLKYAYVYSKDVPGEERHSEIVCIDGEDENQWLPGGTDRVDARFYTVSFAFREGFPEFDDYKLINKAGPAAYKLRYGIYVIAAVSVLVAVLSFVALMFVSGRQPGKEEVCPGPLNKVPFDVLAAAAAAICFCGAYLANEADNGFGVAIGIVTALTALCFFIGLSMSAASRIKQGTLLKNTLIAKGVFLGAGVLGAVWGLVKRTFLYFAKGIKNIPLTWKTVVCFCGFTLLEMIMLAAASYGPDEQVFALFIERLILLPAVVFIAMGLRKLRDSGKALAAGDLSHYTDTKMMYGDIKRHAEDLNNIAVGMSIAVEDRLKSERMKTELITNVSHDIKTPLTSIINYATLIGEEQCDNEKINEYSEVLVRQSERLKRLIEDLVEASKASTGNLDVEPVPCDASVFLDQIAGEYEEKLAAADLTLITKAPEKELRIMADGRRMWRIFDNLMNNICKYALSGTRVYLSLEEEGNDAVFTFKNTSRDELNISEEELMERFTRGDSSRNTEGNGLGLSIARSMAELQGGTLDLSIDGDLFKAILRFPKI